MMDFLRRYQDFGLLLVRVVMGGSFIMHGWPKITGGVAKWAALGKAMGVFGIHAIPEFWGFMAAVSEFGGGICLIVGLFFRPAASLIAITMIVATASHFGKGDSLMDASHAMELGAMAIALATLGTGRFAVREE